MRIKALLKTLAVIVIMEVLIVWVPNVEIKTLIAFIGGMFCTDFKIIKWRNK